VTDPPVLPLTSIAKYRAELAHHLIDQLEGSEVPAEQLLMQVRRLAQAAGDLDVVEWVSAELTGYVIPLSDNLDTWAMRLRRASSTELVVSESLPRIEDAILQTSAAVQHNDALLQARRKTSFYQDATQRAQIPDAAKWEESKKRTHQELIQMKDIAKTVRAELHRYVGDTFLRFAFSELASTIFDRHKISVDRLLRSATDANVVDKIPEIYERLANGTEEAISHAMDSCRRMIVAFADVIYPASNKAVTGSDGKEHKVTAAEVLNRIQQYLVDGCPSSSRGTRLAESLRYIWQRVSSGVHNDIPTDEAQSLFLATYLTLGEILAAVSTTEAVTVPSRTQATAD
jgi:hypothetical protein